jgi:hypothetical protein
MYLQTPNKSCSKLNFSEPSHTRHKNKGTRGRMNITALEEIGNTGAAKMIHTCIEEE